MSNNPFDWRTVLLAKHAQHVAIIHFPIALFIAGVIFDMIGAWKKKGIFEAVAYFNLSAAALAVPPVVLTGLAAWQWQLEGQPLKGILLYHLLAAAGAALLIVANWWIHFRARRIPLTPLPYWRFVTEFLGVALVMLTGHLGGFLSGVNS
jgi:uncharacterized membrane protein